MAIKRQSFLKAALLIAASAGLSGCVYDVGFDFASNGYYDDAYACYPFGGYDAYHNFDYGYAFSNIGFGSGWYNNYFYPGHGIFLFDTFGRRHPMREQHRRTVARAGYEIVMISDAMAEVTPPEEVIANGASVTDAEPVPFL
jgi:hypothetical protein